MNRYVTLAAMAAMSTSALAGERKAGDKPNIVFVLADDMGAMDVGFMGNKFYETPNIDKLASDGMIFTDAYAAGPNCAPSRACIMTGTYTPRHHLYTPGGKSKGKVELMKFKVPAHGTGKAYNTFKSNNDKIDASFTSIAEVLKKSGYVTARFGKWHIGKDTQGFDVSSSDGKTPGKEKKHYGDIDVHDWLTDAGNKFMEKNKKKPFFLFISHWDVHNPINARPEVVKKYKAKMKKGKYGKWNPKYAGMMTAVDNSVGGLYDKVKELGLDKNTIFIFTSDNGGVPMYTRNAPLHGGKGSLFEGGIRVPTCITWPGTIEAGSKSDVPISGVDLMPTFAELAGASLPKKQPVDGESIVGIFKGKQKKRGPLFWHFPLYLFGDKDNKVIPVCGTDNMYWRGVPSSCIRKGDWKLIHFIEDDSIQLFNVSKDIGEKNELSKKEKKKAAELLKELNAWRRKVKAPIPSEPNPKFTGKGGSSKEGKKKKGKNKGRKKKNGKR